MSAILIGTVSLSPAGATVVHRNVAITILGVTTVYDMITNNTFTCHDGDSILLQATDVNAAGLSSPQTAISAVTASAPASAPPMPVITGVTFAVAP